MIPGKKIIFVLLFGLALIAGTPSSALEEYIFIGSFGTSGSGDGEFLTPIGIAVDIQGNIYVADTDNHRIQMFDGYGSFIRQWGGEGVADGGFSQPRGVAVDDSGRIYVADTGNNRVQVFAQNGSHLLSFGSYGSGEYGLLQPSGIAVDAAYIYIADTGNNRIQIFTKSGTHIRFLGGSGTSEGRFRYPSGVTVDNMGNLYVMDEINSRIQKFAPDGEYINQWTTGGYGITVSDAGDIYNVDYNARQIKKWNDTGDILAIFGSDHLRFPRGVAVRMVGQTGRTPYVYAVDTGNARIAIFAPRGNPLPPIAGFSHTRLDTTNSVPLSIQFTYTRQELVERAPLSWHWDFGDGATSDVENPRHTYTTPGLYTVSLTVENEEGRSTVTMTDLIRVTPAPELYFVPDKIISVPDKDHSFSLFLRVPEGQVPDDLSGYNLTVTVGTENPFLDLLPIVDLTFPTWAQFNDLSLLPSSTVWCRAIDLNGDSGHGTIHLLDLTIRTSTTGEYILGILDEVDGPVFEVEDKQGNLYRSVVISSEIIVKDRLPFPGGLEGDFPDQRSISPSSNSEPFIQGMHYNDLDGNGRLGFNDVVVYYRNIGPIRDGDHGRILHYDYDANGYIGFNDVVILNGWVG
ncbi:PKD domain-containing protein [Methanocalculus chunghsingensis]|uniref:PKD domain-containing protein n=1 Tax=Methanocalculus chunghsingensis TaxID=156457 RepID=UPI001B8D2FE1|nr:PKD domain-containing protein [Methanocalculus chunghsingensis]